MKKIGIVLLLAILPTNLFWQQAYALALQEEGVHRMDKDTVLNCDAELALSDLHSPISSMAFSGDITLHSDSSLVRIILMDNHYNEYLVYEAYPILSGSGQFSVEEAAEETAILNNITPEKVSLEIIDASIHLREFIVSEEAAFQAKKMADIAHRQNTDKIRRINQHIEKSGRTWIAGETSVSRMSYQEKKRMFGGKIPNFQGFEYYVGGIFILPGYQGDKSASTGTWPDEKQQHESLFPAEFNWQNRHGMNWVTPVRDQGSCNSCYAFGTTAAVELLANLYFNQKLDYDLSEQQIISCFDIGSCSQGGLCDETLEYIRNPGLVTENCFTYVNSDVSCHAICDPPREQIQITDWEEIHDGEDKKQAVVMGATTGHIPYWKHIAQVVGYKVLEAGDIIYEKVGLNSFDPRSLRKDDFLVGETAWMIKNSWGTSWGMNGFAFVVGDERGVTIFKLDSPVTSRFLDERDIACRDSDGDGYYSWGIGPKPSHCPECPDQADGDDSDECIGPMDEYGNLIHFTPSPAGNDTVILCKNTPDLFVEGTNIRWYQDRKLRVLVEKGNVLHTGQTAPGFYNYFVTQTISGCESAADDIKLCLVEGIPAPAGHDTIINLGEEAVVTAEGNEGTTLKWYQDPSMTTLLHTGQSYHPAQTETGIYTYYVTQTICSIESPPVSVSLKIADFIHICDTTFLRALLSPSQHIDKNRDQLISHAEAELVDTLQISDWPDAMTTMSGLEAFVNLRYLDCSKNNLAELDISANTELRYLNCSENQLSTLELSANRELLWLDCQSNQLSNLNVSGCSKLTTLYCSGNRLFYLDVTKNPILRDLRTGKRGLEGVGNMITTLDLSNNRALNYLDVSKNRLDSLDLSNNPFLKEIYLDGTSLTSLDLSSHTRLTILRCDRNQKLVHLDVSGCDSLQYLYCSMNQLRGLDVSGCRGLKELDCQNNLITNLKITSLPLLESLNCTGNQLSSLNVSGCSVLNDLHFSTGGLSTLNVSGCSALSELDCSHGKLTSLDVSEIKQLTKLDCDGNQLTTLDISSNTLLTHLQCSWNQLTGLDVSSNRDLTSLKCGWNQLTSLDISENPSLIRLDCNDNLLTSLDVSKNGALETFNCSWNQLSGLDLTCNEKLISLYCSNNQISHLDVTHNTELRRLHCSGNQLTTLDISNNRQLGKDPWWWIYALELRDMPSLAEVCTWESFNFNSILTDYSDSPNVCFQIDCNGNCSYEPDGVIGESPPQGLSIYPNPTEDLLHIVANQPGPHSVALTSLNGQLLTTSASEGSSFQLDLSSFPKGVYFLTISSRDLITTRKVIKY